MLPNFRTSISVANACLKEAIEGSECSVGELGCICRRSRCACQERMEDLVVAEERKDSWTEIEGKENSAGV